MVAIIDFDTWREAFFTSLDEILLAAAIFIPKLLGALLILAAGWVIARIAQWLTLRVLGWVHLDRALERWGLSDSLERVGVGDSLARLLASTVYWLVLLTFLFTAATALGLGSLEPVAQRLVAYLPQLFAAVLVIIGGLLAGRLARNLVGSGASAMGIAGAQRLAAAAQGMLVLLAIVVALEQLGVATSILVAVVSIVVASIMLTAGLALAIGSRGIVENILASHYIRRNLEIGETVEIAGRKGALESIGPVTTEFRDGERTWSIPNGKLLGEIVSR